MKEVEILEKNYNIALDIVKNVIGKEIVKEQMRNVVKVGISPRAIKRNGVCKIKYNECVIEISKKMFNFNEDEMMNTLIHEILHTFKDTKGHDKKWKYYADKISKNTKYKITRTRDIKEDICEKNYKWKITCLDCNKSWYKCRITMKAMLQYNQGFRYHKECGKNNLKVECLK